MAKSQVLQLNPQTELAFDGPFTEVVTSYLSLTNPTDQTIYFKVKTTAPRYYCVRPNSGTIQPDGTAKISVMLQPVDQPSALDKDRTRHKFMIQAAYAKNDSQTPDEFWKSVDSSEIMDSKLKVVFNNLNINGSGSEVHSGTRSPDSAVYHDDLAQSDQHVQRRNVQQTSHENRKSSPTESDSTFQKERARIEEENRGLTMQVQELRHKLNTFSNTLTQNEGGLPIIQVVLISLAVFLLGIILGKLF